MHHRSGSGCIKRGDNSVIPSTCSTIMALDQNVGLVMASILVKFQKAMTNSTRDITKVKVSG